MKKSKDFQQLRHVSTAVLLEESRHMGLILKSIITVAALVFILIVWSAFATIDEVAVSFGEIVPQGQVQMIQHLEGGIVEKVFVKNGQKVAKGQALVQMNPTNVQAELAQMRSREISLVLNVERLRAYVNNDDPNLFEWTNAVINSKYNSISNKEQIAALLRDEREQLISQSALRKNQIAVLEREIAQRKEQLNQVTQQKKVWDTHIELLTKEFNMYDKLQASHVVSRKDYLTVLREVNKANGEQVRLVSEIVKTKEAIEESKSKLLEVKARLHEKALKELGSHNDDLLEVRHKIERLEAKLQRTDVTSPVKGLVKGLEVSPGNVIKPGAVLLEVVPYDRDMMVESRIKPRDIGHIEIGDSVKIKILTYDYARYGNVSGRLDEISATTFHDKDNRPYYKATISISRQFIGPTTDKKYFRPGMTVEASIVTGKKTLLKYLLKPIQRGAAEAFSER